SSIKYEKELGIDNNKYLDDKRLPDEPLNDKPLLDEPLPDKHLPDELLNDKRLPDEPLNDKPLFDEPLNDKPLLDEPLPDKPLPDEPLHDTLPLKPKHKEDFYLIHIRDTSGDSYNKKKRHVISDNVEAAIYEIHNLIVSNMNTYENITILEEMEEMDKHLRKRKIEEYSKKYGESSYIYPIANINEKTIAFSYLTGNIVEDILTFPDIIDVEKRMVYEPEERSFFFNEDIITNYTKWDHVDVRPNAPLHLSLISQGKYDSHFISKYDTNYYSPYSAGEGINVFIFDNGFNFNHPNFSNTNTRTVRCLLRVNKGKLTTISGKTCVNNSSNSHGTKIATILGGVYDGVAKNANIYGIEMTEYSTENIDAALEYIRDNYFKRNKSIFNFSFGGFYDNQGRGTFKSEQEFISQMSSMGAVFVASAGNKNQLVKSYNSIHLPSQLNNVISVGGVASKDFNDVKSKIQKAPNSNYGEGIDIFAPYTVKISIRDKNNNLINNSDFSGTSFSTPIVSGVAALVMSEHSNISFDTESMLEYLTMIGQKDVISNLSKNTKNLFLNNGKHIVYSMDNVYYGCGIYAGLSTCGSNCCSSSGYCYKSNSSYCKISQGCQAEFGYCSKS
ncbi:carbohydrate-binding module family 18 protein, partial [Piromyces sp. E2]